jgi:HK97 family phage prohead protease
MAGDNVSIDEFIARQKGAVRSGGVVLKGFKAPSSWNPERRSARFTISAQTEDRDRDIVWQEGLDTSSFEQNPVALMFHASRSWPVGRWSDLAKNLTGRPKRTEATLNLLPEGVEPDADRAAGHIAAGTLTTCSIGFIPKAVSRRDIPEGKKDEPYYFPGYDIKEAELVEVSIVPVPSLREAAVKAAGGNEFAMPREVLEEILDNWAKHPETGLIVPRIEFEAAYRELRTPKTHVAVSMTDAQAAELRTAVERSPPGEIVVEPKTAADSGLIRRAIDGLTALLGKPDVSEEQRIRDQRRADAEKTVSVLKRSQRLHEAQHRLAAVRSRLEAKGLA